MRPATTSTIVGEIISASSFREIPWKNGRGVTTELFRFPQSGGFDFRLSIAAVVDSTPFSEFTGYHRQMVLLAGRGMELNFGNGTGAALRYPFDQVEFSGDWDTTPRLFDGPVRDFNVITARHRCHSKITIFRESGEFSLPSEGDRILVYSPSLPVEIGDQWHLPARDLWVGERIPPGGLLMVGGEILVVEIFLKKIPSKSTK